MTQSLDMSKARIIEPVFDARGNPEWRSRMSPPDDTFALCWMVPDRIIPVIFVPGVMGSNLRPKGKGERWRMDSKLSAASWMTKGAKARKESLRPAAMEVDRQGKVPTDMALPAEELRRRGWGEIGAMSYGAALRWLEEHLNDYQTARTGLREQLRSRGLGADTGESPLTEDEVRLSYRYRFPVHVCGYNWLDDNDVSAKRLARRIDEVIARYRRDRKKCEKVILVTHSMGGLVARYCSEVLGYRDKIFGIVHGVMPAIGAAAVYRRMKAGTEGDWGTSQVLGADAAEVTAVMSSAPGPLQLLPTPEYGNGWLQIKAGGQQVALPQHGDPYGEIYAVRGQWWNLCEDRLINPLNVSRDAAVTEEDWKQFASLINGQVAKFHRKLALRYHPNTHAFCGDSSEHRAYGSVSWRSDDDYGLRAEDWMTGRAPVRAGSGATTFFQDGPERTVFHSQARTTARFSVNAPDEAGDGTVPRRSGLAPQSHCKSFLRTPVEHEPAFNPEKGQASVRALHFTVRAIVRIAQEVQHTSLMYEELRCGK